MNLSVLGLGIWVGTPVAMIGIAFSLASISQPSDMEFWAQRILFMGAALSAASYLFYAIWTSDDGTPTKLVWAAVSGAVIFGVLVGAILWTDHREIVLTTKLYPGKLTVALPAGCANAPSDALIVAWGSNASWSVAMPHTIIQMGGEPMLAVDREGERLIVTKLKVTDDRGDAVAVADGEGTFWIKDGSRRSRPNGSTLIVYDYADNEILRLVYANPRTLVVTGVFRKDGSAPLVMSDQRTLMAGMTMQGSCFGNNGIDVSIN